MVLESLGVYLAAVIAIAAISLAVALALGAIGSGEVEPPPPYGSVYVKAVDGDTVFFVNRAGRPIDASLRIAVAGAEYEGRPIEVPGLVSMLIRLPPGESHVDLSQEARAALGLPERAIVYVDVAASRLVVHGLAIPLVEGGGYPQPRPRDVVTTTATYTQTQGAGAQGPLAFALRLEPQPLGVTGALEARVFVERSVEESGTAILTTYSLTGKVCRFYAITLWASTTTTRTIIVGNQTSTIPDCASAQCAFRQSWTTSVNVAGRTSQLCVFDRSSLFILPWSPPALTALVTPVALEKVGERVSTAIASTTLPQWPAVDYDAACVYSYSYTTTTATPYVRGTATCGQAGCRVATALLYGCDSWRVNVDSGVASRCPPGSRCGYKDEFYGLTGGPAGMIVDAEAGLDTVVLIINYTTSFTVFRTPTDDPDYTGRPLSVSVPDFAFTIATPGLVGEVDAPYNLVDASARARLNVDARIIEATVTWEGDNGSGSSGASGTILETVAPATRPATLTPLGPQGPERGQAFKVEVDSGFTVAVDGSLSSVSIPPLTSPGDSTRVTINLLVEVTLTPIVEMVVQGEG